MSFSICVSCLRMVGLYQKYCPECVEKFNLPQDERFWQRAESNRLLGANYKELCRIEFEEDKGSGGYR